MAPLAGTRSELHERRAAGRGPAATSNWHPSNTRDWPRRAGAGGGVQILGNSAHSRPPAPGSWPDAEGPEGWAARLPQAPVWQSFLWLRFANIPAFLAPRARSLRVRASCGLLSPLFITISSGYNHPECSSKFGSRERRDEQDSAALKGAAESRWSLFVPIYS